MKILTYIQKGKVKNITLDELKELKVQLTKSWEDICTNCGKCCFEKSLKDGVWLINYNRPCKFLKFVGRRSQCTIYDERFAKSEHCYTIPEAIQKKFLPSSCPYVKVAKGQYKAPMDDGSWYKIARRKLAKYDAPYAGTPTGQTGNMPAEPPEKFTRNPIREDLAKPKEWKRRIQELRDRKKQQQLISEGKAGCSDPRQKNSNLTKKPSGHALGG